MPLLSISKFGTISTLGHTKCTILLTVYNTSNASLRIQSKILLYMVVCVKSTWKYLKTWLTSIDAYIKSTHEAVGELKWSVYERYSGRKVSFIVIHRFILRLVWPWYSLIPRLFYRLFAEAERRAWYTLHHVCSHNNTFLWLVLLRCNLSVNTPCYTLTVQSCYKVKEIYDNGSTV